MMNKEVNSAIIINKSVEKVWFALTNEDMLTRWYAPGSPWVIPSLTEGAKMVFILMPNPYNQLTEKLSMELIIETVIPNVEFSFSIEGQNDIISFMLEKQSDKTKVSTNSPGYDESLANLKALLEYKELPFT